MTHLYDRHCNNEVRFSFSQNRNSIPYGLFVDNEGYGSQEKADGPEWQKRNSGADTSPAAPRLRTKCRPARHQKARAGVCEPQGADGKCFWRFFALSGGDTTY